MPRSAMVLNDNETFTSLSGCHIVSIPDEIGEGEEEEFIKDAVREMTPSVVASFSH